MSVLRAPSAFAASSQDGAAAIRTRTGKGAKSARAFEEAMQSATGLKRRQDAAAAANTKEGQRTAAAGLLQARAALPEPAAGITASKAPAGPQPKEHDERSGPGKSERHEDGETAVPVQQPIVSLLDTLRGNRMAMHADGAETAPSVEASDSAADKAVSGETGASAKDSASPGNAATASVQVVAAVRDHRAAEPVRAAEARSSPRIDATAEAKPVASQGAIGQAFEVVDDTKEVAPAPLHRADLRSALAALDLASAGGQEPADRNGLQSSAVAAGLPSDTSVGGQTSDVKMAAQPSAAAIDRPAPQPQAKIETPADRAIERAMQPELRKTAETKAAPPVDPATDRPVQARAVPTPRTDNPQSEITVNKPAQNVTASVASTVAAASIPAEQKTFEAGDDTVSTPPRAVATTVAATSVPAEQKTFEAGKPDGIGEIAIQADDDTASTPPRVAATAIAATRVPAEQKAFEIGRPSRNDEIVIQADDDAASMPRQAVRTDDAPRPVREAAAANTASVTPLPAASHADAGSEKPDTAAGQLPAAAAGSARAETVDDDKRQTAAQRAEVRPATAPAQVAEAQVGAGLAPSPLNSTVASAVDGLAHLLPKEPAAGAPLGHAAPLVPQTTEPQSLKIQLRPESLGLVTATLRMQGDKLNVEMTTEKAEAYDRLKGETHTLAKSLREMGLQVDQIVVQPPQTVATAATRTDTGGAFSNLSGQRDQQQFTSGNSASGQGSGAQRGDTRGENDNGSQTRQPAPSVNDIRSARGLVI